MPNERNDLPGQVIGAAIEVHKALGPGLLESAYEDCLAHELTLRGLPLERQRPVTLQYKGLTIDPAYRLDLLVSGRLVIEIKAVQELTKIHEAQILTYLKLGGWRLGLLMNFHETQLIKGIRRYIR